MSDELKAAHADAVRKIQVLLGRVLTFVASLDTNLDSKLKDEVGSFDGQMADWLHQLTDIRRALSERKKHIDNVHHHETNSNEHANEKKLVLETIYSLQSLFLRAENTNEPNEIIEAIKSVESFVSSNSDIFKFKENTTSEGKERILEAISSFERLINHAPDADIVDKLKGIYSQMTLILLNIIRSADITSSNHDQTIDNEMDLTDIKMTFDNNDPDQCKIEEIKNVNELAEEIVENIEELAIKSENIIQKLTNKEMKIIEEKDENENLDNKGDKKVKKRKTIKKYTKEEKKEKPLDWYEELVKEEQQEEEKRVEIKSKNNIVKENEKKNKFSALKVLRIHVPRAKLEMWPLPEAAIARGNHAFVCKLPGTDLEARAVATNKRTARAEAAALLLDKIVTLQKMEKLPEDVTPLTEEQIYLLNTLEAHNWPNRLQKFCSKLHKPRPIYNILEIKPKFVIQCEACDLTGIGTNTKKAIARKEAAKCVLEQLEEWNY